MKKILRPTRPTCCLRVVCVALTTRCAIAPVWRQTVVWYGTPISDVINLGICRSSLRITDGCCYLFLWAPGQESRVNIILYFNNRAIKKFGTELLCYICFLSLILIKFSENYAQQWCSPLRLLMFVYKQLSTKTTTVQVWKCQAVWVNLHPCWVPDPQNIHVATHGWCNWESPIFPIYFCNVSLPTKVWTTLCKHYANEPPPEKSTRLIKWVYYMS